MVEPESTVSVRKQCELLSISRSGLYYEPVPASADELDLMRRIDELHLKWPHLGSRKLAKELRKQGLRVNRKHVQRLSVKDVLACNSAAGLSRLGLAGGREAGLVRRERRLRWRMWMRIQPSGMAAKTAEPVDATAQRLQTEQSLAV